MKGHFKVSIHLALVGSAGGSCLGCHEVAAKGHPENGQECVRTPPVRFWPVVAADLWEDTQLELATPICGLSMWLGFPAGFWELGKLSGRFR